MVVPPHFAPQVLIISSKKSHGFVGETHHFRNPPPLLYQYLNRVTLAESLGISSNVDVTCDKSKSGGPKWPKNGPSIRPRYNKSHSLGKSKANFTSFIYLLYNLYTYHLSLELELCPLFHLHEISPWLFACYHDCRSWCQDPNANSSGHGHACVEAYCFFSCKQNGRMWQPMVSWWLSIIPPSTNRITHIITAACNLSWDISLSAGFFCWPTTTWNTNE